VLHELSNYSNFNAGNFVDGQLVNMLLSYKSPSTDNKEFLDKLENFQMLLDLREPLFIFVDLNMDLKSIKGLDLAHFLMRNGLKILLMNTRKFAEATTRKRKNIRLPKL
jgi:hypothetical protein